MAQQGGQPLAESGSEQSDATPTAGQAQDRTLESWKADDHEKYLYGNAARLLRL
jgi:hypothetical protein